MIRIAMLTNLITYSLVVSQPLAYMVFLAKAQRALSPAAYIELRQCINPVMTKRISTIYLSALGTGLLLFVLALSGSDWGSLVAASLGLLCLAIDIFLMLRENVPINGVIDQWSTTDYPEDWEDYRTKWFAIFSIRQVVLLVGFFSLLSGAVFQL